MQNGKVHELNLNTGHAVQFQCNKGYRLAGDPLAVCIGGNTWSSTFPSCQRETLLTQRNTHTHTRTHTANTTDKILFPITTKCQLCSCGCRKFVFKVKMDNMIIIKKKEILLFLAALPCPPPPGWRENTNRNVSQRMFHVGQSVSITCPKGHQVKGSGTITCRPDQTWSPISFVCESKFLRKKEKQKLNVYFSTSAHCCLAARCRSSYQMKKSTAKNSLQRNDMQLSNALITMKKRVLKQHQPKEY